MDSSFNGGTGAGGNPFDSLLLQSLMGRLQLRPPYLDTNSYLSHSLDDFILDTEAGSADDDAEDRIRSPLAREEAKLEKEIIRIVHSGDATATLKPNSGQSVAVGDHHICVGFHEDPGSGYRVWEWHGHLMLFDDDAGYSPEYVYGNYFERLPPASQENQTGTDADADAAAGEDGEFSPQDSGLKDLIGDAKDAGASRGRVLHRNSLAAPK